MVTTPGNAALIETQENAIPTVWLPRQGLGGLSALRRARSLWTNRNRKRLCDVWIVLLCKLFLSPTDADRILRRY